MALRHFHALDNQVEGDLLELLAPAAAPGFAAAHAATLTWLMHNLMTTPVPSAEYSKRVSAGMDLPSAPWACVCPAAISGEMHLATSLTEQWLGKHQDSGKMQRGRTLHGPLACTRHQ